MVLYMKVESVEETLDKAKSAEGEVVKEKWVEGGHTEMGEFRDTEGNLVGVLKWLI
jgi:predicted enzyme related to lactoylglutathione lyase